MSFSSSFSPGNLPELEQLIIELAAKIEALEKSVEKLTAGPWTPLEEINAKVSSSVEVRKEGGVVRFRKSFSAKEELPAKTILFRLPPGFRPTTGGIDALFLNASTQSYLFVSIEENGQIKIESVAVPVNVIMTADTVTFSIT